MTDLKIDLKKQFNGKWTIFGEFEIGNSGEYERRVLVSNLSRKKAVELKEKYSER